MRPVSKAAVVFVGIVLLLMGLRHAGPVLVVNRPQPSDLIIVLAGDQYDRRYWRGMELLRAGYAHQMQLDAGADMLLFGRTGADLASEFVKRTAADLPVHVCAIRGNSTLLELRSADSCIQKAAPQKVMIVTSDYHTRRALSIAQHTHPRYTWTAAAADEGLVSDPHWWTHREVVKNVFLEWQKLLWWELVERHR